MKIQRQLILFLIVGGLNSFFGFFSYALFIFIGLCYPLAIFFATCLALVFNFKTTGKIVFNNTGNYTFVKFITTYALIYPINLVLIQFTQLWTENLYLAGFQSMIPVAMLSFVLNKYFVFNGARVNN